MKKTIPAKACNLKILDTDLQFGTNGGDATTAPISLLARSAEPIAHWYFGSVIHDLSGMKLLKKRIVIDWLHDDNEQLGYLNKFEETDDGLLVSGALVPFKDSDRATEIIAKQAAGVPYEASIDFRPRGSFGLKIEEVGEGNETEVNGKTYAGPITVIREWPLNAVAICPHGADDRTAAYLNSAENENAEVEIEVMKIEDDKKAVEDAAKLAEEAKAAKLKADESDKAKEAAKLAASVEAKGEEARAKEKLAEQKKRDDEKKKERAEFAQFNEAFGDKAGVYFAEGLTFEDATTRFCKELRAENEELRASKEADPDGLATFQLDGDSESGEEVKLTATDEQIKFAAKIARRDPAELKAAMIESKKEELARKE